MSLRALLGTAALAVAAAGGYLLLASAPAPAVAPESAAAPGPPTARPEVPQDRAAASTPAGPERNPFEFGDAPPRSDAPVTRRAPAEPPPSAVPSPPATLALVGLVRSAGGLKAVLRLPGGTAVLAAGESDEGVTVISLDDGGALVRGPDGERRLTLPE